MAFLSRVSTGLQRLAQALAAAHEPHADVSGGQASDRGDLRVALLVEHEQHQGSIEWRELANRRVEPFDLRVVVVRARRGERREFRVARRIRSPVRATQPHPRGVQRDAIRERRERRLAAEAVERSPELQRDLLAEVLSVGSIARVQRGDLADHALVRVQQLDEARLSFGIDGHGAELSLSVLRCAARADTTAPRRKRAGPSELRLRARAAAPGREPAVGVGWAREPR
jgi:hypothetical protein